jgi:hypothetical protein
MSRTEGTYYTAVAETAHCRALNAMCKRLGLAGAAVVATLTP